MLSSALIYSIQTSKGSTIIYLSIDESIFGIDENYKIELYNQIFDFVYYSEGTFTYNETRNMPVTLRLHYFSRLNSALEQKSNKMRANKGRR